jgi:APA family basic amino acid/polyamine antiporter
LDFLCARRRRDDAMRRTEPELVRPYRCWGYPWVPAAFLAGAAALTVTLWLARPVRSSIGLVLIFSGLIFYRHWRAKLRARIRNGLAERKNPV